jgi:class 3 adenylate cyclase
VDIESFIMGEPTRPVQEVSRVLATVLFTDIVDSTARAAALGDQRWRRVLEQHDHASRDQIEQFSGHLVKSTGDGCLATFDSPGSALRCAIALRDTMRASAVPIRAGLHVGEVEKRDGDIGGIAVHIGSRVSAQAKANEILVSRTVVDLVTGSNIEFEDRGEQELKGVPGIWQLFAVTD